MKQRLNFSYTIPFKRRCYFAWKEYTVNLTSYEHLIMPKIPRVVNNLLERPNSRQEVIVVNQELENNSCLISLQFQIVDNELLVSANYRSQCKVNGRPVDTLMLEYVSYLVTSFLRLESYSVRVNVANYHRNEQLTQENKDKGILSLYKRKKQK